MPEPVIILHIDYFFNLHNNPIKWTILLFPIHMKK